MQQPVSKPSVCKPSLNQVSSSHAKGTSNGSLLKYDSILLVDIQNLIESRKKHPNNVLICYLNTRTCRAGEGIGGVTPPPPPLHPTTILGFVGILAKCVGKFSWPNVVGKFGVYYHKKQNAEFYQYPVPEKSNFYRQWRLLKKLYKIFTDDYDNNEYSAVKYTRYLAVKYPRFFTINIIWCL